ncbi:MAG TPA: alpha-glucan family phosphorylase [Thermomicrobiales bacterium]|nr:alpha-glucan family phosphorylase [Thermomicrobiales bacterium]
MTLHLPRTTVPSVNVPARLTRLADLAYNLWWRWHEPARALFHGMNPILWEACEHNPVSFLGRLGDDRLAELAADAEFLAQYDAVVVAFDAMLAGSAQTWVSQHAPELAEKRLAYFSAEFGLHRALPIYSGGLGVLAGDHLKEASDLGLPTVGVSLLYRQGYLRQRLDASGWQQDVTADFGPENEPTSQVLGSDGSPVIIEVPFDDTQSPLRIAVWQVLVGRVPIYLMDSDLDANPGWTRTVSSRLYGGDREHRLRQEVILGIAGVRALRAMNIDPDYWHANEGHAALHLLERIRELVEAGASFDQAADQVRRTTVFTTHTPVAAGHDVFSPELIDRYFSSYWPQLGLTREEFFALGRHTESGDGFNLTALSLRLAGHRNAVSERHGEITREMWKDIWPGVASPVVPITSITNGVHLPTWISPRMQHLLDRHLDADWRECADNPLTWESVRRIPEEEFWHEHRACKQELIDLLDERARQRWASGAYEPSQVVSAGPFLDSGILTIGFARRFATYKRATLLFHDVERLASLVNNPERPIQIIFAGKAHPADEGGKLLIQEIYNYARDPRLGGRIAFAEDYDMGLAAYLVAGVDVWLNNPRAPYEASGTSGMKAAANGVPNLSVLDGWWCEGWEPDNSNGWGIEPAPLEADAQDVTEAEEIYRLIETRIAPLYYERDGNDCPIEWSKIAKEAIRTVAPAFSARRMVIEYILRMYVPAATASPVKA